MDKLEKFYAEVGADYNEVLGRLGGIPALVEKFLSKFEADGSMAELEQKLAAGATEEAFRAAHTLKGLCANLGIQKLYEASSAVTELLRAGDLDGARLGLPTLKKEYDRTLAALKDCGIGA